jgi:hypothetical protein
MNIDVYKIWEVSKAEVSDFIKDGVKGVNVK